LNLFANLTSFNILTLRIAKSPVVAQAIGYPNGYPLRSLRQGVLSHDPRISCDTEESLKMSKEKWIRILDRLVLNLNDQQLATSFAIL